MLDEVVVGVFRAPRSYTREDVVEISCHGGRLSAAGVLEAIGSGATIEEGLDHFLLAVDKAESVARFGSLAGRFEQRGPRAARSELARTELGQTDGD